MIRYPLAMTASLPLLLVMACLGYFLTFTYENLLAFAQDMAGAAHLNEYIAQKLTPAVSFYAKVMAGLGMAVCVFSFVFIWRNRVGVEAKIAGVGLWTKRFLLGHYFFTTSLPVRQRQLLAAILALFIAKTIFIYQHYELQYDDCWTYNRFISKGFLFSWWAPHNNHPLYAMFCALLDKSPLSAHWVMRTPNFIAALLSGWFFFRMVYRTTGFWGAFAGLAWLIFSPPFTYYVLYARGYMFGTLFFILSLQSLFDKKHIAFELFSFLSFASTQGMALLLAPLWVYWGGQKFGNFKRSNYWPLLIFTALSVFFYAPSILAGSFAVASDAISQPSVSFETVVYQFSWLTGLKHHPWIYMLFWLAAFGLAIRNSISFLFPTLMSIPLICWMMGFPVPERVFTPLAVVIALVFGTILASKWQVALIVSSLSVFLNTYLVFNGDFMNWSKDIDEDCAKVSQMLTAHPTDCIYLTNYYLQPRLELELSKANHGKPKLYLDEAGSLNHVSREIGERCGLMVFDKEDTPPGNIRTPLFHTRYFVVYVKK